MTVCLVIQVTLCRLDIRDEIFNGADLQAESPGELDTSVAPRHTDRSSQLGFPLDDFALLDNLRDDSHRRFARQPTQIHRCLGMALSNPDSAVPGPERENVTRPSKILFSDMAARQLLTHDTPVVGRNPRRHALGRRSGIDAHRVGGVIGVCVGARIDHERELELVGERDR